MGGRATRRGIRSFVAWRDDRDPLFQGQPSAVDFSTFSGGHRASSGKLARLTYGETACRGRSGHGSNNDPWLHSSALTVIASKSRVKRCLNAVLVCRGVFSNLVVAFELTQRLCLIPMYFCASFLLCICVGCGWTPTVRGVACCWGKPHSCLRQLQNENREAESSRFQYDLVVMAN